MQDPPLVLPALSIKSRDDATAKDTLSEMRMKQVSVFTSFVAGRNSARVKRYFIKSKSAFIKALVIITVMIIFMGTLALHFWGSDREARTFIASSNSETVSMVNHRIHFSITSRFLDSCMHAEFLARHTVGENPIFEIRKDNAQRVSAGMAMLARISGTGKTHYSLSKGTGVYIGSVSDEDGEPSQLLFGETNATINAWPTPDLSGSYPNDLTGATAVESALIPESSSMADGDWYVARVVTDIFWAMQCGVFADDGNTVATVNIALTEIQALLNPYVDLDDMRVGLVLNEGNTVIALTGTDSPFDEYRGKVFLKTTGHLTDPLWRAAFDAKGDWESTVMSGDIFWGTYDIDGEAALLNIRATPITLNGQTVMTLYLIYRDDLQVPVGHWIESDEVVIYLVVLTIIAVSIVGMYYGAQFVTRNRRSRMTPDQCQYKHVKDVGIKYVPDILKHIEMSHGENHVVVGVMKRTRKMLANCGENLMFNADAFYASIENERVRDKFAMIFGGDRTAELVYEKEKEEGEVYARDPDAVAKIFSERQAMANTAGNGTAFQIKSVLALYNEERLFSADGLAALVDTTLKRIRNPDHLLLLWDSIEFNRFFMQNGVANLLRDKDEALALMLLTMLWHTSMGARDSDEIAERYFLLDSGVFRLKVRVFLVELYDHLDGLARDSSRRWRSFVDTMTLLAEYSGIGRLSELFAWGALMSAAGRISLDAPKSRAVIGTMFSSSMFSFMFHEDCSPRRAHAIINPDRGSRSGQIDSFIDCMSDVFFVNAHRVISQLLSAI